MQDNVKAMMTKQPTSSNKCPKCGGSGIYVFEQRSADYAAERGVPNIYPDDMTLWVSKKCPYCNGGFAEDVIKAKRSADIPTSFYNKRLKDFDWSIYVTDNGQIFDSASHQNGIKSFVEKFDIWEKKNMGLYIWSKTKGSGKTFLASCICNELMSSRAIKTRFIRASELINISQSGDKNALDEYKRNPMKLIYECKFLVIDDIGQKNTGREWLEDELFKLLDYRMVNSRMTMITSNLAIQELPFNERITDRINKLCFPFHLPEICVRSKEIQEGRRELMKELSLTKE